MIELYVCIGSACHIHGAHNVVQTFQHLIEQHKLNDKVALKATFCLKECGQSGVSVTLNGKRYRIIAEDARAFFKKEVLALTE